MEIRCLEKFKYILTGKFNDTHKKFQLALNVLHITSRRRIGTCNSIITMIYCMIGNVRFNRWMIEAYLWCGHPLTTSLRVTIVSPTTSWIGQGSQGSLMAILSATIHALTVGRIIIPVSANWSTTNKNGEWVNSASYKKCKELFLKDTSRLKSFLISR